MRYSEHHKAETHRRIVKIAAASIRESGLDGIGVSDLMKKAGLTHGGFYAHFKSRDELVAEALAAACDQTYSALRNAADRAPPVQRRSAVVKKYVSQVHRDHRAEGCPIAALGSEVARLEPSQREKFDQHIEAVVELIQQKGNRADALRYFSEMVGALLLSRTVSSKSLSNEILRATSN